jgi:hypothetical protein
MPIDKRLSFKPIAMMLISLADYELVDIVTPWGIEQAIDYLGQLFLPIESYKNAEEAIAACRNDLEAGLFSIVVQEPNQVRIWCPIPRQMQMDLLDTNITRIMTEMNFAELSAPIDTKNYDLAA